MNEKLVSIIVPVYNCEEYLKDTIESIIKQTYSNWELILIDDCSTDNSMNIMEQYVKEVPEKIRIVKLVKNEGVSKARNIGLTQVKGKYIAYLDADDFWKPDKLEKQIEFMETNHYYFTYTKYTYLKEKRQKELKDIPEKMDYKDAMKNTAILTSTVIVNIEKIEKQLLQMPDIRLGQDSATWWQILKTGITAYGLKENLTYYRRRKDSLSSKKIVCLMYTWRLYRKIEKMNLPTSIYYFFNYFYNASKKRIV